MITTVTKHGCWEIIRDSVDGKVIWTLLLNDEFYRGIGAAEVTSYNLKGVQYEMVIGLLLDSLKNNNPKRKLSDYELKQLQEMYDSHFFFFFIKKEFVV